MQEENPTSSGQGEERTAAPAAGNHPENADPKSEPEPEPRAEASGPAGTLEESHSSPPEPETDRRAEASEPAGTLEESHSAPPEPETDRRADASEPAGTLEESHSAPPEPETEPRAEASEPAGTVDESHSIPPTPESEPPAEFGGTTEPEILTADDLLSTLPAEAELDSNLAELRALVEAIVYITEEPVTLAQLTTSLGRPKELLRQALDEIAAEYEKPCHGIAVREVAGGYKMTTKAEHHEAVREFVKSLKPPLKLSLAALETLAVIAYKQPVTAPEIMDIRGVQGAGVLKTLLDRKLIQAAGRKNVIGKPVLYKTTREFLVQFGLKDLAELPTLKEFEEIRRLAIPDNGPSEAQPESSTEPPPPAAEPAAEDTSAHG